MLIAPFISVHSFRCTFVFFMVLQIVDQGIIDLFRVMSPASPRSATLFYSGAGRARRVDIQISTCSGRKDGNGNISEGDDVRI